MEDMTPRTTARASALAKTLQREMVKLDLEGPTPTHGQCLTAIAAASGFDTLFAYQQAVKKGAKLPDWSHDRLMESIKGFGRARHAQRLAVADAVEAVAGKRSADPFRQLLGEVAATMGSHEEDSFDVARMLAGEARRVKAGQVLEDIAEGPSLVEWDMVELDDFDDDAKCAEEYYGLIGDMLGEEPDGDAAHDAWWAEYDRTLALVVARDEAGLRAHASAAVAAAAADLVRTEGQRRRAVALAVLNNSRILFTVNRTGIDSPIGKVGVCYQVSRSGWSEPDAGGPTTCVGFMTVTHADGTVAGILRTEHTVLWDDDDSVHARDVFWEMDSHDANEVYKAILNDHLPSVGHSPTSHGMQDWIDEMAEENRHVVVADPGVVAPMRGHRLAEWMANRMVMEISATIFRMDPDAQEWPEVEMDWDLHAALGHPGLVVFSVTGSPWDSGSGGNDPRLTGKRPPISRNPRDEARKAGLNRYVASMGRIGEAEVLSYDLYDYPAEFGVA